MNFSLVFLVAILVLFMADGAESENDCEISDSEAIEAATNAMKNCNSNIKHCFDAHEGKDVEKLYCKGMMKLITCAFNEFKKFSEDHNCRSPVLYKWVYVVLQYCTMGSRLGICIGANSYSNQEKQRLANLAEKYDDRPKYKENSVGDVIIPDGDKECARDIHIQCAASLVRADTNLCSSVNNFVTCYDNFINGSVPLPSTCIGPEIPGITKQFDKVIDHFSKYLIRLYQENPQSMCQVATEVLDGDCMPGEEE